MQWLAKLFEAISLFFYRIANEKPETPALDTPMDNNSPEEKLRKLIEKNSPGIGPKMLKMASEWFFHKRITNRKYMVLVDFDYNEASPRMWVVDRETGKSDVYKVAHGRKSDPDQDGSPDEFSNISGSNKSSLGAMVTLGRYGKAQNGWSKFEFAMQLEGLQAGVNNNVKSRAIVFHSSHYVNDVKGSLIGDSLGCFAVSLETAQRIIDDIDEGALFFAYHKQLEGHVSDQKIYPLNKAIRMIKDWEGFRAYSYKDPVGVWTIGYGTTTWPNGQKVKEGQEVSESEASQLLLQHVRDDVEPYIRDMVKAPLNENQYNALVSFVYNVGSGNFGRSTMLEKLNERDYVGAANEFPRWNKAGGKVLEGLVNRRNDERKLFMEGN